MDTKHEDLTAGEQRYFEHVRAAEKQGISLAQYYRATGLSVYTLYNVRRGLIRKGVLARRCAARPVRGKAGEFVAVRVATGSTATRDPMCRLRHPSGWVMECGSLPDAQWLSALISAGEVA